MNSFESKCNDTDINADDIIHIVEVIEDESQQHHPQHQQPQQPQQGEKEKEEEEEEKRKLNLTDMEKRILINFYKEHPLLWNGKAYPYQKNKLEKHTLKEQMVDLFHGKYKVEILERTFHVLRTSMLREVKTTDENGLHLSDKKWKFFDDLSFLKDVLKRGRNKRTTQISSEDTKNIIQFFSHNRSVLLQQLNADNLERYQFLMERLATELENKYSIKAIKLHFDSLLNIYKREKRWVTKYNKGNLLDPSFSSAWEYYSEMDEFLEDELTSPGAATLAKQISRPNKVELRNLGLHQQNTYNNAATTGTVDHRNNNNNTLENPQHIKVVVSTDDTLAGKEECYTIFSDRNQTADPPPFIITGTSSAAVTYDHKYNNEQHIETTQKQKIPTPQNDTLKRKHDEGVSSSFRVESANRFGQVVADSLMQCEVKDWPRMKKQIMDLFFEYEIDKEKNSL